jgi:signal transduction histidine kinase
VVLLAASLLELLTSSPESENTTSRALAATIPPLAVAVSRTAPPVAGGALVLAWLIDSVPGPSEGTLGAGLAMLVIAFGVSAWGARPWPWLAAVVAADTFRWTRVAHGDATDVYVDWAFLALAAGAGHLVRRRTEHADRLGTRLQISENTREREAREAVARERAVIARELHDIVAHSVSLMVVQAGTARPAAARVDAELAEVLATIEQSGRGALAELRRLLGVLRVTEEADLRPMPDLTSLTELVDGVRAAGLDAHLRTDVTADVPPGIALCAYRTVQEGLTNALRHAAGSSVEVTVTTDSRALDVRVVNGSGDASAAVTGSGTGLTGLRERVLLCGGTISSGPVDQGYQLAVRLPLDAS